VKGLVSVFRVIFSLRSPLSFEKLSEKTHFFIAFLIVVFIISLFKKNVKRFFDYFSILLILFIF